MKSRFYIQFPGLAGDVKDGEYKGWFTLSSLTLGSPRRNVGWPGREGERGTSDLSEIHFTMDNGASTAVIMREAIIGTVFQTVKIVQLVVMDYDEYEALAIELKKAILSSASTSTNGGASAALVFEQITYSARGRPPRVDVRPVGRP